MINKIRTHKRLYLLKTITDFPFYFNALPPTNPQDAPQKHV